MVKPSNQFGFSVVEISVLLVLVAAIGLGGYAVYQNRQHASVTSSAVAVPQKTQTKTELRQASQALDAQPIDSSLDPTQLDKDLQNLN